MNERTAAPETGVYEDIDPKVYRSWEALSSTTARKINNRTPKHARNDELDSKEPTEALAMGNAVHTYLLERDEMDSRYVVAGKCEATTKAGMSCAKTGRVLCGGKWYCATHAKGRQQDIQPRAILSPDQMSRVKAMAKAVGEHKQARLLMKKIDRYELSMIGTDKDTGCKLKCRLDALATTGDFTFAIDIKTTEDAGEAFSKSVATYGYHQQAAHYIHTAAAAGIPLDAMVFIAVEKKPPHDVVVRQVPDWLVEIGWNDLLSARMKYAECIESNIWPGFSDEVIYMDVPEWQRRRWELEQQKEMV